LPKNLIPWWDSNPGLLVPEADAMSIAPRRQGFFIPSPKDFLSIFIFLKYTQ
jgi:hypothetical protein